MLQQPVVQNTHRFVRTAHLSCFYIKTPPNSVKNLSNTDILHTFVNKTRINITYQEICRLYPSEYCRKNRLLLITPDLFYKLEGMTIERSRMHILVSKGTLELDVNGTFQEMHDHSFLEIIDNSKIRIKKVNQDLQAWGLMVTFEFASESLKNLRPFPTSHLLNLQYIPIWNISQREKHIIELQLEQLKDSLVEPNQHFGSELIELYYRSFCLQVGNMMFSKDCSLEDYRPYMSKKDFVTWGFLKLVSKNYKEKHNIDFYAESLFVSAKHLTRIIKEMTGKTPYSFICLELLHNAMVMLDDEKYSIAQIANELHFADQASFCKFFKKQKNISPMAYRRSKIVSDEL